MRRELICALCCAVGITAIHAKAPPPSAHDPAAVEAATRLQVFLDRAGFGPGKIDGRFGDFTHKAVNLYLQSIGQGPVQTEADAQAALANQLSSVDQTFIDYTVTQDDSDRIGKIPASKPAQAKQHWLGYESVAEDVAERFHVDPKFLAQLNPGVKPDAVRPGTTLKVPNVEPFDLKAVEEQKKQLAEKSEGKSDKHGNPPAVGEAPAHSVQIGTKEGMLKIFEGDRLVGAFPVTCGSAQIPSPIGDWKVEGIYLLPIFRYDKQMLQEGKRSENALKLPSGPNSPVGVTWIELNKSGIGIHGTDDPATIGRAVSHGCIRLANWDAVRVANMVEKGTPVKITP